jgi:hypothetical protein
MSAPFALLGILLPSNKYRAVGIAGGIDDEVGAIGACGALWQRLSFLPSALAWSPTLCTHSEITLITTLAQLAAVRAFDGWNQVLAHLRYT